MSSTDRTFGRVTVLVGEKTGKYPDGNSVLVRGRDATVLIDPSQSAGRRAAELGTVDQILLSHVHEDHVAGLHAFPQARVAAHRADLPGVQAVDGLLAIYGYTQPALLDAMREWVVTAFHYVARPDAAPYDDGAVFDLGGTRIRAIHLPGHTRGHSALLVEPEGVLFLGDIDLTGFGPYYGDAWSDLADFERSLARVAEIEARVRVSFHHAGVIDDADEFRTRLTRFAGRIAEREAALLAFLDEPRTMAELVAHRFLYPAHAQLPFIDAVEERSIAQHLARLTAAGAVEACGDGVWRRA